MTITKTTNGNDVSLSLAGRLDTITSIQLSNELDAIFSEKAVNLVLDMKELDYISSAGLRVVFTAQKKVTELGTTLEIIGTNETVKSVFDITGFSGILNIK